MSLLPRPAAAVPRSDATTAYDLVSDVIACITQDPRRLDLTVWIGRRPEPPTALEAAAWPACGTVACVAGWIVLLAGQVPKLDTQDFALRALGFEDDLEDTPAWASWRRLFHRRDRRWGPAGTPAYARAVAKALARLQARDAARLRTVPVPRP